MSPTELGEFERDGVICLRGFLKQMAASLVRDWEIYRPTIGIEVEREKRFVRGILPSHLGSLPYFPPLLDLAREVCGGPAPIYMNRLLLKDRNWAGGVDLHQDLPYFSGENKLAVFVPLVRVTSNDGPMFFVKGSHKFGKLPRGTVRPDQFGFSGNNNVTYELEPGDAVLMDFLTWHGSIESQSANERPLIQIAYGSGQGSRLADPFPCVVAGATIPDGS